MYEQRKLIYQRIESFTNSKVLCFVNSDRQGVQTQIAQDVIDYFAQHLDAIGVTKKISLVIYSRGGSTLAGWNIVNLIKQFCDEFSVIIPMKAHSTATLMTLGASSVMMTKQATLGPIDPSVNGPLNPILPGTNPVERASVSVESVNGYFEYAKSLGIVSEESMVRLLSDFSKQVNPLVLGDVYRSRAQIRMLGERLLSDHMEDPQKIEDILKFLCSESGSHDYTINRREAANKLGLKIIKPDIEQYAIIKGLHDDYSNEMKLLEPLMIDQMNASSSGAESNYSLTRGLLESVDGGSTRYLSEGRFVPQGIPVTGGMSQSQAGRFSTFEGWRHEQ